MGFCLNAYVSGVGYIIGTPSCFGPGLCPVSTSAVDFEYSPRCTAIDAIVVRFGDKGMTNNNKIFQESRLRYIDWVLAGCKDMDTFEKGCISDMIKEIFGCKFDAYRCPDVLNIALCIIFITSFIFHSLSKNNSYKWIL